ncbi:hypothetical protein [Sorangium cellulosum]|uniref:Uncharacterized protein n=1 Tax=Sorangium cellulosum So0157-2 TaxID=1254432 RepID=S4Y9F0_SORCE|nr:hypothetical protein [Sorangium cellulosum]AGP41519.1 hypothetical protein SCE1572_47755 [Sorangium cellulosum So0157-2]
MNTLLDWSRFERGSIGPERAFEAFVAQLFERMIRREYGPDVRQYVLKGAGGDGGVEAFARLRDDKVIGLQAKWFTENLDASRVAKIRTSIDTALERFPSLVRYLIALPQNLTLAPPRRQRATRAKGGVDRWEELVAQYQATHPDLVLVRWDEAALLDELSRADNHELGAIWFRHPLVSEADMDRAFRLARGRLRNRYVEDLHVTGEIEERLAADLFYPERVRAWLDRLTLAQRQLTDARALLSDAVPQLSKKERALVRRTSAAAKHTLGALIEHAATLEEAIQRGPEGRTPSAPDDGALSRLAEQLEKLNEKALGPHIADLVLSSVQTAVQAPWEIASVAGAWEGSTRHRLIIGSPGLGKTHSVAYAVREHLNRRLPAVLIVARDVDPRDGAQAIMARWLDRPGWSLGELLDALEVLAVLREAAHGAREANQPTYARALIVIDGIEESTHFETWASVLEEFTAATATRPRIHIAVTLRDSTMQRLEAPARWSSSRLKSTRDTDVAAIFQKYARHYEIDARDIPWIAWALPDALSVRLFADVFQHRKLTLEDGLDRSMERLFAAKLERVSEDARRAAKVEKAFWPARLVFELLVTVVDAWNRDRGTGVEARELLGKLLQDDVEFTADRARAALDACVAHGLVIEWRPWSVEVPPPRPRYQPATHHLTDYLIGKRAAVSTLVELRAHGRAPIPEAVAKHPDAAVVFGVVLAENGYFLADDLWSNEPAGFDPLSTQLSVLSRLPPALAGARASWVRTQILASTPQNRQALHRLVLPVARIPDHPLGVSLLDETLRAMPLAQRDPVWSVPEYLTGTGPWAGGAPDVLDSIALHPGVDRWDGLPLLLAWTCASVVEQRRCNARKELARWGASNVGGMVHLLRHMATVDDLQIVEDIVVAALGAVLGAPPDEGAVVDMARCVHDTFFAADAPVRTTDVVVREAGRAMVERAVYVRPGKVDALLTAARPPFPPRGPAVPAFDHAELAKYSDVLGGHVVTGDLSRYVAPRCMEPFLQAPSASHQRERRDPWSGIPEEIVRAAAAGDIGVPEKVRKRARRRLKRTTAAPQEPAPLDEEELVRQCRELDAAWAREEGREPEPAADITIIRRVADRLSALELEEEHKKPRRSVELSGLFERVRQEARLSEDPAPGAVRNAMIAAVVRSMGWSKECFCHYEWTAPPAVVDDAIARLRRAGPTHGHRAPIATFREKYVWVAVNVIAGELADRLPVWDEGAEAWVRLDDLSSLGNGMPDPLPMSAWKNGAPSPVWHPEILWTRHLADVKDLAARAERWLTAAPLPDPSALLRAAIEPWADAAILSLHTYRQGHMSCVDQAVWVTSFAVPQDTAALWMRDARYLYSPHNHLHEERMTVGTALHVSPAIAIWAAWLEQQRDWKVHRTLDSNGRIVNVKRVPLAAEVSCGDEEEARRSSEVWFPNPLLGKYLGVVSVRGNQHGLNYLSREGKTVAVEIDEQRGETWVYSHQYLAVDRSALLTFCRKKKLVLAWAIRLLREATPALWYEDGPEHTRRPSHLGHRSRDVYWLVFGDPATGAYEPVLLGDTLEPFPHYKKTK